MPGRGALRRGRRRGRRRTMMVMSAINKEGSGDQEEPEYEEQPPAEDEAGSDDTMDKLQKLAKLLKDKGVITESEYDLLFG